MTGRVEATWKRRRRLRAGMLVGAVILPMLVAVSVLAPLLSWHDPLEQNIANRLKRPSAEHVLGTDRFGRDVLSRLLYGGRVSLVTGGLVMAIAVLVGVASGLVSGYYGGRIDFVIQRVVDVVMAFPGILLAIGIMAFMGQGMLNMVVAISIVNTPRLARMTRGLALEIREVEFVEAARAMGARDAALLLRHVLPAALGPIAVQAAFTVVHAIRLEASLNFIGLGVPPPHPSWGGLLDDGKAYIQMLPWMTIGPGVAIALTILALSLIGDALRDHFDPRGLTKDRTR